MTPPNRPVISSTRSDVAAWLVGYASRRAPARLILRLREEWLADLSEHRDMLERLHFAVGCLWAALVIDRDRVSAQSGDARMPVSAIHVAPKERHVMAARSHRGDPLQAPIVTTATAGVSAVSDINVTPLIDVMLVLLVTLIMTLPVMTHAVKIELPRAQPVASQAPLKVIDLDIDFDGTPVWNGTAVRDYGELERYFQAVAQQDPQPEIRLRPDPHVKYDVVAKVLAAAQRNQVSRIGFANTADFEP